jgi:hypothetical protein
MNDDGTIGGKSRATAPPRARADPAPTAKGKKPRKTQIQYKIQYKYVLYIIHALSREGKYTTGGRVFCIKRIFIVFCIVFVFFGGGHP